LKALPPQERCTLEECHCHVCGKLIGYLPRATLTPRLSRAIEQLGGELEKKLSVPPPKLRLVPILYCSEDCVHKAFDKEERGTYRYKR